jgi:WD40 repeat protein
MMGELNRVRRDTGGACDLDLIPCLVSGRLRSGLRRLVRELLLLGSLVAVTGYNLERSGMRDSGSARATILGEHTGPVRSIAFAGGISRLVSLDTTGESWLWDTEGCRVLSSREGPKSKFTCQGLDPHGKALVTGGHEGTIIRWDLATGEPQALFASAHGPIRALAVAGDGRTIAVSDDESVFLLDSSTRRVRLTLQAEGNVATALAFSPDGRTLASASVDRTVRLWDPATGQMRATLRGSSSNTFSLAFAPDGTTLASAAGR